MELIKDGVTHNVTDVFIQALNAGLKHRKNYREEQPQKIRRR